MRIKQFEEELKKINFPSEVKILPFLIYDEFTNKIIKKTHNINLTEDFLLPICIRQEFYSHIVLLLSKNKKIYFYDPDSIECNKKLKKYIFKKCNIENIIQIKTAKSNINLCCTESCLIFLKKICLNHIEL